jgi:dTDP-4-amino-4,6-dideoxygalactose transaminase
MGDGGAILTSTPEAREQVTVLRDYGQTAKYRHVSIGYNSRLDELQAALLRSAMLPRLAAWIARRRAIAAQYLAGIHNPTVPCMGAPEGSESTWHLFPVLVSPPHKTAFLRHLKQHEVGAGEHYPSIIPNQPALTHVPTELTSDLAVAHRIAASEVSLPIHPYLRDDEVARVIEAVNAWQEP